ncbi:MAG: metal-dependent hydrolase [Bacteroidota bacterium]
MKEYATGLTVTWFGHSAFLLESVAGKRVLVDPWLDNPKAPAGATQIQNVHIICVTHGHDDHLGNTEEIAKRTGAAVVCIHEIALFLKSKGVKSVHGINMGGSAEVHGIRVTMTDARHSSSLDIVDPPLPGGIAAGYVIRFENGFTVYHAGDTSLFGDMQLIGSVHRPDLALIPIGDYYTMGPRDAAHACTLINPKFIIGMHYGTVPALTGTPEQLKEQLPEPLKDRLRILTPGVSQNL